MAVSGKDLQVLRKEFRRAGKDWRVLRKEFERASPVFCCAGKELRALRKDCELAGKDWQVVRKDCELAGKEWEPLRKDWRGAGKDWEVVGKVLVECSACVHAEPTPLACVTDKLVNITHSFFNPRYWINNGTFALSINVVSLLYMGKLANPLKKRVVFRILISAAARDNMLEISERIGITGIAVTSRLVKWFADQDSQIQASILGLYPDVIKKDTTTMILEKMAK